MSDMNMLGRILYDGGIEDLHSESDISIRIMKSHAITCFSYHAVICAVVCDHCPKP